MRPPIHQPFKDGRGGIEIGLKPIEDRDWLEIDELFNQEIQDKLTLIEERRSPDWYHREGHVMKGNYSMTVFRSNLRRPIAKENEWKIQWCTQPKEMTREELLKLEGEKIQEAIDNCQCILNHTPSPLDTWKKYNGK